MVRFEPKPGPLLNSTKILHYFYIQIYDIGPIQIVQSSEYLGLDFQIGKQVKMQQKWYLRMGNEINVIQYYGGPTVAFRSASIMWVRSKLTC